MSVTPDDFLHAREIYPGSKVREEPHTLPTDSRSVSALVPLTPRAARWTPPSASLQVALAARAGRSVFLTSRLVCPTLCGLGPQREHFKRLSEGTGVPLSSMLFFDDEHRNIQEVRCTHRNAGNISWSRQKAVGIASSDPRVCPA